jgi:TRAP-type C4-dicarboxylate transport system permease large subunit
LAELNIVDLMKSPLPMYAAMIAVLLLVTLVPALSEWLPRVWGLID